MQPRTALIAAVACAVAAIAIVAVDRAMGVEAQLQAKEGEGWITADSSYREHVPFPGGSFGNCYGDSFRLVVDNDSWFAAEVDVRISYWSGKTTTTVIAETWRLDAGQERMHAFTIPQAAFDEAESEGIPQARVNVDVGAGKHYFSACAEAQE